MAYIVQVDLRVGDGDAGRSIHWNYLIIGKISTCTTGLMNMADYFTNRAGDAALELSAVCGQYTLPEASAYGTKEMLQWPPD
jgi:hypothetical protein